MNAIKMMGIAALGAIGITLQATPASSTVPSSSGPSSLLIRNSHFGEPLRPSRPTSPADDDGLAKILSVHSRSFADGDEAAIVSYAKTHPGSPWNPALLSDMGASYLRHGRISKAIDTWQAAWTEGKDVQDPDIRRLIDRTASSLTLLYAKLGRFAEVETMFQQIGDRKFSGPSTEDIQEARDLLGMSKGDTRHLYICGAQALAAMLLADDPKGNVPNVLAVRATPAGMNLEDVQKLAAGVGRQTKFVQRTEGGTIPTRAVIHWKEGHFSAIVGFRNGLYQVIDPIYQGDGVWMTRRAIEEETTPEMLVPADTPASPSLKPLDVSQAAKIWGRGPAYSVMSGRAFGQDADSGKQSGCPMCGYNIEESSAALLLSDTPVGYDPPVGPSVRTVISYNQRDDGQSAIITYTNMSPKWTLNWIDFIIDSPAYPGASVSRYTSGTTIYYDGYSSTTGRFAPEAGTGWVLYKSGTATYQLLKDDGSKYIYSQSDGATSAPRKIFLTEIDDPQGNAIHIAYNGTRISTITDAGGRITTFSYNVNNQLVSITDPYGRKAVLGYDINARLASITDIIGITSRFTYDQNVLVNSLTTPYGTTNFAYTAPGTPAPPGTNAVRYLQATDPLGNNEREEWYDPTPGFARSDPPSTVPVGMPVPVGNTNLQYRNSMHWDKDQYVAAGCTPSGGCDYTKARVTQFMHTFSQDKSTTPGEIKQPLENRVWYQYLNQNQSYILPEHSPSQLPVAIGKVLDDGTTQLTKAAYANPYNKITQSVDPIGRTTNYTYSSDIDLATVTQQQADGSQATIAQYTYNTQHRPLTSTDAAGQTTTYEYNAAGQVTKATDSLNESTIYHYDAQGRLTDVVNANGATQASYTYDAFDRVATATDSEGWTVSTTYDAADRPLTKTYPDGTKEVYVYHLLDLAKYTDRTGRVWKYDHDAVRNITAITDPSGAKVQFAYTGQGHIQSMTDGNGHTTSWAYDLEGRPTVKTYPDSTTVTYAYWPASGRLKSQTDALGQVKTFNYAKDDQITAITYTGAVNPTPNVSYTYDTIYRRPTTMVDGTGTTSYAYGFIGALGALQVSQVTTPATTISYTYDELGRTKTRTVGGAGSEAYTYDALGRMATHGSDLGAFTYGYLGQTGQIASRSLNGTTLATTWSYQPNLQDRRLAAIHNTGLSAGQHTDFGYTIDQSGMITATTQSSDASVNYPSPATQAAGYNNLNQLTTLNGGAFTYDADGNLTNDGSRTYSWDAENRLVAIGYVGVAGKATTFAYDGMGRRVSMSSTPAGGGTSTVTNYVWCGSSLCQALSPTNVIQREYLGEGEYLASGSQSIYYGVDQIGSVRRAFTSASAPAYDYDSYGNLIGGGTPITDYAYAGLRQNLDSGLYLSDTRPYNPGVGRWLRRDMAGELADPSANLYAYANGNPIAYRDPNGRFIQILIGAAAGAATGFGADLLYQLYETGGRFSCISGKQLAASAGVGALIGSGVGLGLYAAGIAPIAVEGATGLGDLTASEVSQIQNVVDAAGRPLDVVGSTARAARTATSDIDYTTANANFGNFEGLEGKLPGIDPEHGLLRGYADPNVGPSIRFEPGTAPSFVPGAP